MSYVNGNKDVNIIDVSAVLSKVSAGELFAPYSKYVVFPGFCDVHVHFRQPGFSYKETISSGCDAASRGGYTAVCTMPNLIPVPDNIDNLQLQLDIISKDAKINVFPYAAITVGELGNELSDFDGLSPKAVAFSDDGRGVQNSDVMKAAMLAAKRNNKIIVAHCEDNSLLKGGYIHDGEYAKLHNHKGICSESEFLPIKRDIELVKETGCSYHVCHISTKESVDLIRKAKNEGVDITCETAPHYLILDDMCLQEDGRFKMNPPLRSAKDREALIEGLLDGTIDMIATDHAPHSLEEKAKGLEKSAFGIVGLETAFPLIYTNFIKTGLISLERAIELFAINPRRRFGISMKDECTVWDLNASFTVDSAKFLSKGKATPFEGERLFGECVATICNGTIVYNNGL